MSKIEYFILHHKVQPGDAILLQKKFFGMLDHFAVYVGRHNTTNKPLFVANYAEGVQLLEPVDLEEFLTKLIPIRIERFKGNNFQRKEAVQRALARIGERRYNILNNNCEHFKNYVQINESISPQVVEVGKTVGLVGLLILILGIGSEKKQFSILGLVIILIAFLTINSGIKAEQIQINY